MSFRAPPRKYLLAFTALLAIPVVASHGCSSDATNDCIDGNDNDGDGLIDDADPGCALNGDLETPDPVFPACSDGTDNDGDGLIDSSDPGCDSDSDDDESNPLVAACRDGIDNDGDGLIDFPNDPGCGVSLEDSEEDDCPDGSDCPACANGIDDDGDGTIDYPDDLGCNGASDGDEFSPTPSVCGGSVGLVDLPPDGQVLGSLVETSPNDLISQGCGGTGAETAYKITVNLPAALQIRTDFPETTVDTVVYLQSECGIFDSELGCNDDGAQGTGSNLFIPRVEPGDYFIIVDSQPGSSGDFKLKMDAFIPEGEPCLALMPNCAPNLECRLAGGNGSETCEEPVVGPSCDDEGTSRQKNVPQVGDLLISEYMANPSAVADAAGEWFEVLATADVDIGGLQIGRAEPGVGAGPVLLTLDPTQCLPVSAGTHLLFAREANTALNGGLPPVDHIIGFGIVNAIDGLFIGMDDSPLHTVTYQSTTNGVASSRDPAAEVFCNAVSPYGDGDRGTPGTANPSCPAP